MITQNRIKETKTMKLLANYVFSGSGGMFAGQLGAYKACEELYNPLGFCGTSGGGLCAALLARGNSADSVIEKIMSIHIPDYIDSDYFGLIEALWDKGDLGFIKGIKLHSLFRDLVPEKFKELSYPLTIVTTDINKRSKYMFSSKETPETYVADALRATISLPGIFEPFKYNGMLLVDGGLSENFYLDCFKDSPDKLIGIKINETHDFDEIKTLKDLLLQSLYTAIIQNENKNIIDETKELMLIKLVVDCKVFDFSIIDKEQIGTLVKHGYQQTKLVLAKGD